MRKFPIAYLSNKEFQNWGDMSGLLTSPLDSMKPVLGASVWMDFQQAVLYFYWGFDGERLAIHSHAMDTRGPCPKCRAQCG